MSTGLCRREDTNKAVSTCPRRESERQLEVELGTPRGGKDILEPSLQGLFSRELELGTKCRHHDALRGCYGLAGA